jgi:hypothetical protein
MPPARTGLWSPVEELADLDVVTSSLAGNGDRIELVDRRVWTELVSLTPAEAGALAAVLAAQARRAGWVSPDLGFGT